MSADAPDGTTVIDRGSRSKVVDVIAVDAQARPAVGITRDPNPETNERETVYFVQGYQPKAGVVSNYNPLDALRREIEE
jgi:hypothetical protein